MLTEAVGHMTVISIAFTKIKLCPLCTQISRLDAASIFQRHAYIRNLILMTYPIKFDLELRGWFYKGFQV